MKQYTKLFIFIILFYSIPVTLLAENTADSGSVKTTITLYNKHMIYPQARPFRGLVLRIDDGNREFALNSPELHRLLSDNPAGEKYIQAYAKNMKIAKPLALISTALTLGDIIWFVRNPDVPSDQSALFWGTLAGGQILNVSAGYFASKAQIELFSAIRIYNLHEVPNIIFEKNKTVFPMIGIGIIPG